MTTHLDFVDFPVGGEHEVLGKEATPEWMLASNELAWMGFTAEYVLADFLPQCRIADTLAYDLDLGPYRVEVKTRTTSSGWTHPEKFRYLTIPTHDGRAPIKPAAQLVLFCWYSLDLPSTLWLLGFLDPDEFYRVATLHREGEPLPRGGFALPGGSYSLEISRLRKLPRAMLEAREIYSIR